MDPEMFGSFNSSTLKTEVPKDANGKETPATGYQHKIHKVNVYIINRYKNDNCFKYSIIVGGIVTLLLLILASIGVFHINNNGMDDATVYPEDYEELVLAGKMGLLSYNHRSKSMAEVIYRFHPDFNAYEAYGRDKFFWGSNNDSTIYYYSNDMLLSTNNTKSSEVPRHLLTEPRLKPQDMAYDHIAQNLYIIDKISGSLVVINVETKKHDILMTNLVRPHHIELDPQRGLLFILQQSHSILRGSMDGRSMVNIREADDITAMAVDRQNKRVYWVNSEGIVSSDYQGENLEEYSIDSMNIVDLAVINNELFWLWQQYRENDVVHHILYCKLKNGICEGHAHQDLEYLGDVGSMRVIHSYDDEIEAEKNPCKIKNGGCQHLCLLSSAGSSHSCACNLGWKLGIDRKSCTQVKEFLLYTMSNFFRGRILDSGRNVSVDAIWPTPYQSKPDQDIRFDYDPVHDRIYFGDDKKIYSTRLRSNWSEESLVFVGNDQTNIKDIAYDWTTGNLYTIQEKSPRGYRLQVVNVISGYNKTIVEYPTKEQDNYDSDYPRLPSLRLYGGSNSIKAHSLAIQPATGNLYYVITESIDVKLTGYVSKVSANGTEITRHPDTFTSYYDRKSLAIDKITDEIYWVNDDDGKLKTLKPHTATSTDLRLFTDYESIKSIDVHRKWLYYSTHRAIWRVDKLTGQTRVRMAPVLKDRSYSINNFMIVSDDNAKQIRDQHPCNANGITNGGCEQFCFMLDSKATCACRDGESIGSDGKCKKDGVKIRRFPVPQIRLESTGIVEPIFDRFI